MTFYLVIMIEKTKGNIKLSNHFHETFSYIFSFQFIITYA